VGKDRGIDHEPHGLIYQSQRWERWRRRKHGRSHYRAARERVGCVYPRWHLVYFSGPGAFSRAGASNIVIARCQGIAIADIAIGGTGYIKVAGIVTLTTAQWDNVTGGSGGLLSANAYYVDVTPGRPTVGPPSAGGQFITLAGIAASTTQLRLMIQPPIGL
jgi:hypothetical protein